MKYQILQGDNRETLKTLADNSIDAIVTDPPYGIDFLGKAWDANTGAVETYQECLRVLKPGGHIVAFSAARTYHHLAITLEQAGFEIRDQIMWIYSSGFPKSQDVGKSIQRTNKKKNRDDDNESWQGWGTALKPAHEPICLARKPIKLGSVARNVQIHGVGALNIDAARIPYATDYDLKHQEDIRRGQENATNGTNFFGSGTSSVEDITLQGRFPSNVIGEIEQDYQKYFYCPKVSRKERHIGHEMPPAMFGNVQGAYAPDGNRMAVGLDARKGNVGNNHPTVKPIELMKYLIKLITPPGGIVLDPFNGSGSTGCAAVELGHEYIGCELDPKYVEIAKTRIEAWNKLDTNYEELFE
jgi:site-specific DNA-methyltransferase (adenine-specific)